MALLGQSFGRRISWSMFARTIHGVFLDDLKPHLVAHAQDCLFPEHVFVLGKDQSPDVKSGFAPFSERNIGYCG